MITRIIAHIIYGHFFPDLRFLYESSKRFLKVSKNSPEPDVDEVVVYDVVTGGGGGVETGGGAGGGEKAGGVKVTGGFPEPVNFTLGEVTGFFFG